MGRTDRPKEYQESHQVPDPRKLVDGLVWMDIGGMKLLRDVVKERSQRCLSDLLEVSLRP